MNCGEKWKIICRKEGTSTERRWHLHTTSYWSGIQNPDQCKEGQYSTTITRHLRNTMIREMARKHQRYTRILHATSASNLTTTADHAHARRENKKNQGKRNQTGQHCAGNQPRHNRHIKYARRPQIRLYQQRYIIQLQVRQRRWWQLQFHPRRILSLSFSPHE